MKPSRKLLGASALALALTSSSFAVPNPAPSQTPPRLAANDGHGAGNGGGGEPLFHSMADQISRWLAERAADGTLAAKLELAKIGVSEKEIVDGYESARSSAKVKFIPTAKLDEECANGEKLACDLRDTSRTCMNDLKPFARIVCDEGAFDNRPGDEQFALVFHEYLGIAGIETNDGEDFSRYPASKNLMRFANPRTVVRWELDSDRKEPAPKYVPGCDLTVDIRYSPGNPPQITPGVKAGGYRVVEGGGASLHLGIDATDMSDGAILVDYVLQVRDFPFAVRHSLGLGGGLFKGYIEENPKNAKLRGKLLSARNAREYAKIEAKIDPALDRFIPPITFEEALFSRLPTCKEFLGRH